MRVEREVARVGEVVRFDEGTALALRAEARIFELDQDGARVAVVDLGEGDVARGEPGHREGTPGRFDRRGAQEVLALERVRLEMLAVAGDPDGPVRRIRRPLRRRDDHRLGPAAGQHDLEQVKRIADERGREDVVDRRGVPVEQRERIPLRAGALVGGDLGELSRRRAVAVHVQPGRHRVVAVRAGRSVGTREVPVGRDERRRLHVHLARVPGVAVDAEDGPAATRLDRGGGPGDHRAGGRSPRSTNSR